MRGRLLLSPWTSRFAFVSLSVIVTLCVISADTCFAQGNTSTDSTKAKDTTKSSYHEVDELTLEWFKFTDRHPSVSVIGGTTSFDRKDLSAPIEKSIAIGLELGFRRGNTSNLSDMAKMNAESFYLTYHKGADVSTPTLQIPETINAFRFGAASRNGYGYKFGSGNQSVTFLHGSSGLAWTIFDVAEDSAAFANNQPLATFGSSIRFGEAWMPAIEFRVADPLSIQLQYTWSQVYSRHMFWYWAGSGTIEAIADGLTVWFVREIAQSSPTATPIMYFLLRNGVSAAFKALRMNRMNWPFNTEAPLNMHTFSVGATIIF